MPWWARVALIVAFLLVVFVVFVQAYIIIRLQGQNHLTRENLCKLYVLTKKPLPEICLHI